MSDDLVNQLTLNFLISKNQLQKLNQKSKEISDQHKTKEIQAYSDRIKILFNDLLVNQPPDDLMFDVKNTFDKFIDRSIYYFKAHDNSEALEIERTTNKTREIYEDIDYEKQEKAIENGNYKERSCSEESQYEEDKDNKEEDDEEDDKEDDEEDDEEHDKEYQQDEEETTKPNIQRPVLVTSKYKKTTNSVGVDDIQKLPLDWFQNVRKDYIKNNIIPRTKNK